MQEFLDFVLRQLIDYPDDMILTKIDGPKKTIFKLQLRKSDIGKVIGKHGQTIIAIRNLLGAAAARHGQRGRPGDHRGRATGAMSERGAIRRRGIRWGAVCVRSALIALLAICRASAVEFSEATTAQGVRVTVCRVETAKDRLDLFLRDDRGVPLKTFDALQHWLKPQERKLIFAMNAGMYEEDRSPVGLFVSHGRELAPLNLRNAFGNFYLKPNGVFLVTEAGALVVESSEYPRVSKQAVLATQSGPLLVRRGRIHPAFKSDSDSRLYRNGVGVPSAGVALFAITEGPLNLYEFAAFFREVLHCPEALFLDGTVCSLYAPALRRDDRRIDLGPMIGVTEAVAKPE